MSTERPKEKKDGVKNMDSNNKIRTVTCAYVVIHSVVVDNVIEAIHWLLSRTPDAIRVGGVKHPHPIVKSRPHF